MNFQEKKDLLKSHGIGEGDLDDVVHDALSMMATNINNVGIDAQLTYLFQANYTTQQIIDLVMMQIKC